MTQPERSKQARRKWQGLLSEQGREKRVRYPFSIRCAEGKEGQAEGKEGQVPFLHPLRVLTPGLNP